MQHNDGVIVQDQTVTLIGKAFIEFGARRQMSDIVVSQAPLVRDRRERDGESVTLVDGAEGIMDHWQKRIFPPCPAYALPSVKCWLQKGLERCLPKIPKGKDRVQTKAPAVPGDDATEGTDDDEDSDGARILYGSILFYETSKLGKVLFASRIVASTTYTLLGVPASVGTCHR